MKKLLLTLIASPLFILSNAQIIETIAGNGVQGYSGDGGQATAAEFYYPNGVGFDNANNMLVADESNAVIRKVTGSGIISTVAGNEAKGSGYSGDGGPATAAELYAPEGVWGDKKGNFYIADLINRRIRMVNTSGIISTFAGNGTYGYSGNGGPATAAELGSPYRVAIDTADNVYIADQADDVIWQVNTTGIINVIAGIGSSGYSGDNGPATAAELKNPYGLSVDISGNVYIADCGNNRIRKVSTSGIITTVAGNGINGFYGDGGQATSAELYGPFGVGADAFGNIYIDDQSNQRIRVVNASGVISTFAGTGFAGYNGDGIPATSAQIDDPWDVSVDAAGNVYIADEVNQRVREVPGITTAINQPANDNSVLIYPNPNKGTFNLICQFNRSEEPQSILEVYNLLGEKIFTQALRSAQGHNLINLPQQSPGAFFYKVTDENGTLIGSGKFVIE